MPNSPAPRGPRDAAARFPAAARIPQPAETAPRETGACLARQTGFVVVANLKGGSGKSMVAFNLGVWLAGCGARVRLIDLDPQKTLTDLVAVRREQNVHPSLDVPLDAIDDSDAACLTLVDAGAADVPRMRQAISRADILMVPVIPGQPDIWATQRFLQMVKGELNAAAQVRLVVNRADPLGVRQRAGRALPVCSPQRWNCRLAARLGRSGSRSLSA